MNFKTLIGKVKFSKTARQHIILRHPIMEDYLGFLKEVLETPQDLRYSSRSEEVLLFYRFFDKIEGGKYIAVAVNQIEKFILTAYLTHRIKAGEIYEKEQ